MINTISTLFKMLHNDMDEGKPYKLILLMHSKDGTLKNAIKELLETNGKDNFIVYVKQIEGKVFVGPKEL